MLILFKIRWLVGWRVYLFVPWLFYLLVVRWDALLFCEFFADRYVRIEVAWNIYCLFPDVGCGLVRMPVVFMVFFCWFGGWRSTTCKCYSFSNILNASLYLGFNMPGQEPFAFYFSSQPPNVKYVTLQKSHTNYNIRNPLPPMMQRHVLEERIP